MDVPPLHVTDRVMSRVEPSAETPIALKNTADPTVWLGADALTVIDANDGARVFRESLDNEDVEASAARVTTRIRNLMSGSGNSNVIEGAVNATSHVTHEAAQRLRLSQTVREKPCCVQ